MPIITYHLKHLKHFLFLTILLFSQSGLFGQMPALKTTGTTTQLIVEGKPFIILGGEIHNSTGSDKNALKKVCKDLKDLGLNTVLAYAYWELMEPEEGKFNFELVDELLQSAKSEKLKIGLVWFGSWKSTASSYVPEWVKTNPKRFPRYTLSNGKSLEMLSPFAEENMKADAKAYAALMSHLKEVDADHTVILTQVENEPGCFDNYRDYAAVAQNAWAKAMPADMINYLKKHKGKLFPALEKTWADNGYKTTGTWEEILGTSTSGGEYKFYTEELFMAYHYSKYLNYVAAAGRKHLDLPAFCNAWLYNKRGFYPHGTCNPHVLDAYRAGGKSMDFYSPNTYTTDYDNLFSGFVLGGNTLFIPESGLVPAGALYSIAEYKSLGFSPFGIDDDKIKSPAGAGDLKIFKEVYATIGSNMDFITAQISAGNMRGLYVNAKKPEHAIPMGDYTITALPPGGPGFSIDFGKSINEIGKNKISFGELSGTTPAPANAAAAPAVPPPPPPVAPEVPVKIGSAMVIQQGKDEFLFIGYGLKLNFELKTGIAFQHLGFAAIDEGVLENNHFVAKKRLNGDEQKVVLPENQLTCLKVKLYRF